MNENLDKIRRKITFVTQPGEKLHRYLRAAINKGTNKLAHNF